MSNHLNVFNARNKFLTAKLFHQGYRYNYLRRTLWGGRVVRWCWVNFQCRGVLLIWIIVGQGSTALAVGAGGGCLDIFSLVCRFSFLSPPLWETARYRLKYCLKGPLSPKQPTNQHRRTLSLFVADTMNWFQNIR